MTAVVRSAEASFRLDWYAINCCLRSLRSAGETVLT